MRREIREEIIVVRRVEVVIIPPAPQIHYPPTSPLGLRDRVRSLHGLQPGQKREELLVIMRDALSQAKRARPTR